MDKNEEAVLKPILTCYDSYRTWALQSIDTLKGELLSLCFPIFVHCYLILLFKNDYSAAQRFASIWAHDHTDLYDDELQSVLSLTSSKQWSDEAIFLPGNRILKKLKSSKFTIRLCKMSHSLLLNFLSSDIAKHAILSSIINDKMQVLVGSNELPESYTIASNSESELNKASCMIPPFELDDYVPGMNRKTWPVIDCYMPSLFLQKDKNVNINHSFIKVPDTKNDKYYKEIITKLIIPRQVLESHSSGSNVGATGNTAIAATGAVAGSGNGVNTPTVTLSSALLPSEDNADKSQVGTKRKDRSSKDDYATMKQSSLNPHIVCNTIKHTYDTHHVSSLICMDINSAGNRIACGFQDSVIRVWDITDAGSMNAVTTSNKVYAKTHQLGRYNRTMSEVIPKGKEFPYLINNIQTRLQSTRNLPILHSGQQDAVYAGRTGGVYKCNIRGQSNPAAATAGNTTASSQMTNMIELIGHSKPVFNISQDYYSNLLISTSADQTLRLWNTSLAKCISKYTPMTHCWDVDFAPFGYYFGTAGHDRTVNIYSTDRLTPLRVMIGHISDVTCIKWHPNTSLVLTGSDDRTCRLWDIRTGHCVRYFQAPCNNSISCIAVSPNGMLLAAGNTTSVNNGYVWDIGSNKLLSILTEEGTSSTINSISFDPTSTVIATGGSDAVCKIWNVDSLVIPSLNASSSCNSFSLISPTHRYHTKNTPIYNVSYLNTTTAQSIRKNILFVGGPIDNNPVSSAQLSAGVSEGQAVRNVGINYAIPDSN